MHGSIRLFPPVDTAVYPADGECAACLVVQPDSVARSGDGIGNPVSCDFAVLFEVHELLRMNSRKRESSSVYDVPYMQRTRDYYRAQGYRQDYRWPHFDSTPFTALTKPLSDCRVGVITTAMPDTREGRQERKIYSSPCLPPPQSMYTDKLSWHKSVTHTEDVPSFLPLEQLQHLAEEEGLIAGLTTRFHCLPTEYSQRKTSGEDAPEILKRLRQDQADIALLVPL